MFHCVADLKTKWKTRNLAADHPCASKVRVSFFINLKNFLLKTCPWLTGKTPSKGNKRKGCLWPWLEEKVSTLRVMNKMSRQIQPLGCYSILRKGKLTRLTCSGQQGCRRQPKLAHPGGGKAGAFPAELQGCGRWQQPGQLGHVLLPADEVSWPLCLPWMLRVPASSRFGWQRCYYCITAASCSRYFQRRLKGSSGEEEVVGGTGQGSHGERFSAGFVWENACGLWGIRGGMQRGAECPGYPPRRALPSPGCWRPTSPSSARASAARTLPWPRGLCPTFCHRSRFAPRVLRGLRNMQTALVKLKTLQLLLISACRQCS